jgi:uncharacterized protein
MGEKNVDLGPGMLQAADRSLGVWVLLFLIRFYITFLSPFFGGSCKFYPSCSNYAFEAVMTHGARRGSVLAVKRLLRCRPFTKGGFDPVPDPNSKCTVLNPEGVSLAIHDATTVACLGKPFAAVIRRQSLRVRSKEETAR